MPLDIKDVSKNYELRHSSGAVFTMKHWTIAMQEVVDRDCLENDGKGGWKWNITRERAIKIDLCVENWTDVTRDGNPLPCTEETKKQLPVGIMIWILREIDERAGLRITEAEKKS